MRKWIIAACAALTCLTILPVLPVQAQDFGSFLKEVIRDEIDRQRAAPPSPEGAAGDVEWNTDRRGGDIKTIRLTRGQDHRACARACIENGACRSWTWVPTGVQRAEGPNCWLKGSTPQPMRVNGMVSGLRGAGLQWRAQADPGQERPGYEVEWNTDRRGSDIQTIRLTRGQDHRACARACIENGACRAWTWVPTGVQRAEGPNCWLKDSTPRPTRANGMVSGLRGAGSPR